MPDEIDAATDQAEAELIKHIARRPIPYQPMNASEVCFSCGAQTGPERRWCNARCRDTWESTRL